MESSKRFFPLYICLFFCSFLFSFDSYAGALKEKVTNLCDQRCENVCSKKIEAYKNSAEKKTYYEEVPIFPSDPSKGTYTVRRVQEEPIPQPKQQPNEVKQEQTQLQSQCPQCSCTCPACEQPQPSEKTKTIIERLFLPKFTEKLKRVFDQKNFIKLSTGVYLPTAIKGTDDLPKGDSGFILGAGVGRYISNNLSADLSYFYRSKNEVKKSSLSGDILHMKWGSQSHVLMFSGNFYFPEKFNVVPYLRAGVGGSYNVASKFHSDSHNSTTKEYMKGVGSYNFAWQLGFGMNIPLYKQNELEIEYMRKNLGKIKTNSTLVTIRNTGTDTDTFPPVKGKIIDNVFSLGIKTKF